VSECLEDVVVKDARRIHEHPVRRVHYFEVFFVISIPNLIREGLVVIDEPVYLIPEGADSHAVCHGDGERMMELHLLLDILEVLILDENSSSRVVIEEGCAIQYFIIVYDQNFFFLLGIALNFFKIFEFDCVGVIH
jgi:hypothetical protein